MNKNKPTAQENDGPFDNPLVKQKSFVANVDENGNCLSCGRGMLLDSRATPKGNKEALESIMESERGRFDSSDKAVEVYYTPDNAVFLKIDQQTFEIVNHEEEDSEYRRAPWLAGMLRIAINRLMEKCDALSAQTVDVEER